MREVGLEVESGLAHGIAEAGQRGCPITCVGWRGRVLGVFVFREQLREGVQQVFQSLRSSGLEVTILSGDCAARTGVLGQSLDVAVETDLLPEDKAVTIRHLRQTVGALAMVGDGLNDAPALAEADVGIAMDCGADVSRDAADVCLLGSTLDRIPWIYELAKVTVRTIRQNLFWAFAYNIAGIALAVAGWLNPIWAAVAMVGSSLFVITNSLRLAAFPDQLERNAAITGSPDGAVRGSPDPAPMPNQPQGASPGLSGYQPQTGASAPRLISRELRDLPINR